MGSRLIQTTTERSTFPMPIFVEVHSTLMGIDSFSNMLKVGYNVNMGSDWNVFVYEEKNNMAEII